MPSVSRLPAGPLRRRSHLGATVLLVAGAMVACDSVGPGDGPLDELARNRALWEQAEPTDYSYAINRLCFCGFEARGPARVVVQNGVVVEQVYVDTGDPVVTQFADLFPAVEGLFDILESAYQQDAADVQVTYDPDTGVPIDFSIDYIANAADDEVGYAVTESVQALPQH